MIKLGSKVMSYGRRQKDAHAIIREILKNDRTPLAIQEELVKTKEKIWETTIGKTIKADYKEEVKRDEGEVKRLESNIAKIRNSVILSGGTYDSIPEQQLPPQVQESQHPGMELGQLSPVQESFSRDDEEFSQNLRRQTSQTCVDLVTKTEADELREDNKETGQEVVDMKVGSGGKEWGVPNPTTGKIPGKKETEQKYVRDVGQHTGCEEARTSIKSGSSGIYESPMVHIADRDNGKASKVMRRESFSQERGDSSLDGSKGSSFQGIRDMHGDLNKQAIDNEGLEKRENSTSQQLADIVGKSAIHLVTQGTRQEINSDSTIRRFRKGSQASGHVPWEQKEQEIFYDTFEEAADIARAGIRQETTMEAYPTANSQVNREWGRASTSREASQAPSQATSRDELVREHTQEQAREVRYEALDDVRFSRDLDPEVIGILLEEKSRLEERIQKLHDKELAMQDQYQDEVKQLEAKLESIKPKLFRSSSSMGSVSSMILGDSLKTNLISCETNQHLDFRDESQQSFLQ